MGHDVQNVGPAYARRWESDIEPSGMVAGVHIVPQLTDKIDTDVTQIDVEVARSVRIDGASERREVFENVSKGRDEVEDGLLHQVVRLGNQREKVVDGSPDEGDGEVQGVNLYGLWMGETEPGGEVVVETKIATKSLRAAVPVPLPVALKMLIRNFAEKLLDHNMTFRSFPSIPMS